MYKSLFILVSLLGMLCYSSSAFSQAKFTYCLSFDKYRQSMTNDIQARKFPALRIPILTKFKMKNLSNQVKEYSINLTPDLQLVLQIENKCVFHQKVVATYSEKDNDDKYNNDLLTQGMALISGFTPAKESKSYKIGLTLLDSMIHDLVNKIPNNADFDNKFDFKYSLNHRAYSFSMHDTGFEFWVTDRNIMNVDK